MMLVHIAFEFASHEGKMTVDLFTEATEDGNTPDAEHEQHGEQF